MSLTWETDAACRTKRTGAERQAPPVLASLLPNPRLGIWTGGFQDLTRTFEEAGNSL